MPAGTHDLAKGTQSGRRRDTRDDAVAATILAVSAGWRKRNIPLYGSYDATAV